MNRYICHGLDQTAMHNDISLGKVLPRRKQWFVHGTIIATSHTDGVRSTAICKLEISASGLRFDLYRSGWRCSNNINVYS